MKSPAFQFYPADYLSDMKVRMLSWPSKGVYMDLLCYCWREEWIPNDSSAIAQLCGCHDIAIIEPCMKLFDVDPENASKLTHKRLNEERIKQQEFREERVESGKRGANKRWKGHKKQSKNRSANGSAKKELMAKNGSSVFCLLSSSSFSSLENTYDGIRLPFNSSEYHKAFEEWIQYNKEKGKKLPPSTLKKQFNDCLKLGEVRSIQAISNSISKNYTGIFEPPNPFKTNGHQKQLNTVSPEESRRRQEESDRDGGLAHKWAREGKIKLPEVIKNAIS